VCFGVFYLFRLAETLVGFVVCRWMLVGGCLVFVGLRLHGGFLGGADFGSFVAGLVMVFGGDACGGFGWCCAWWLGCS